MCVCVCVCVYIYTYIYALTPVLVHVCRDQKKVMCLLYYSLSIPLWHGHHVFSASTEAHFFPLRARSEMCIGRLAFYMCVEIQHVVFMITQQSFLTVEPFLQHHIKFLSLDNHKS